MVKKWENGAQFHAVLKALCYCGQKIAFWRSNSSLLDSVKMKLNSVLEKEPASCFSLEGDHTLEALSMSSLREFELNLHRVVFFSSCRKKKIGTAQTDLMKDYKSIFCYVPFQLAALSARILYWKYSSSSWKLSRLQWTQKY